jgi:Periplasmic lysozyme inhibitor of I-type lysozyme
MKLTVFFVALFLTASPALAEEAKSFAQTLSLQGVTFKVNATTNGSINKLMILADGLKKKAKPIEREIEGTVTGAEIADLNADGSPEIYVYVTSAGSGSYGSLVAYSTNRKKSLSEIYLPDLNDDKVNSKGYLGHDQFTVIEQTLARRFPVYKPNDTNSNPTGGIRQLEYRLTPGEAGWVLRLKKATEIK